MRSEFSRKHFIGGMSIRSKVKEQVSQVIKYQKKVLFKRINPGDKHLPDSFFLLYLKNFTLRIKPFALGFVQ